MKNWSRFAVGVVAAVCLALCFAALALRPGYAQAPDKVQKGEPLSTRATGTFEVKLVPAAPEDKAEGATLGRMSIDKQFHGDLEGTSKGEMLSAITSVKGSAGYVAIERVSGSLQGRSGTFVLQHTGTMTRGTPALAISVVPDSGTGQLTGLAGKLTINIADGKHFYEFEYTLAPGP
jgi:hypothetical protein